MLYLAHLSCAEALANKPDEFAHSVFTCVVEAENVDVAQNKLRNLIFELRKKQDLFGRATEIYLDDLIEITKVPPEGFLGRYESRTPGEEFDSVSTSLPGVDAEHCKAYTLIPPEGQGPDSPVRLQPFITF